jgi:putative ATPase
MEKISSGVPNHLKDSHYPGAAELNHGIGYKYAHDYPGNYVKQQYMPDELKGTVYYTPTTNGVEKKIGETLKKLNGETD